MVAFYVPWITSGGIVPFSTEGWQTVTIPFSQFNKYATLIADKEATQPTFQTVIDDRNAATYRNFGMGFVNTDFSYLDVKGISLHLPDLKSTSTIGCVVPCKSVVISDYPEDEETAE